RNGIEEAVLDQDELPRWDMRDRGSMALEDDRGRADEVLLADPAGEPALVEDHAVGGGEGAHERGVGRLPLVPSQFLEEELADMARELLPPPGWGERFGDDGVATTMGRGMASEVDSNPLAHIGGGVAGHRKGNGRCRG